ncbi:MAG: hypothetical protein K5984_00515, partial [Bacteroidales bacterium]|nr:hypothetical protein [Bacteroidales bacterium]
MNKTIIAAVCLLAGVSGFAQKKYMLDDTFYRAQFGTSQHLMSDHDFRFGQDYIFGVGKRISDRNSFLVSGTIERYFPENNGGRRWLGEIDLLHSYLLSDPQARFQVSTLAGGGFDIFRYDLRWRHSGNLQAGLDLRYAFNDKVSLVVSPLAKAFIFEEGTDENHFEYGVSAGIQLDLSGKNRKAESFQHGLIEREAKSVLDFSYVSAMAGVREHYMGQDKIKAGDIYGVNVGKKFTPVSGLVGAVYYGDFRNTGNATYREAEVAVLYRLDALNLLYGFNEDRPITLAGLVGPGFDVFRSHGTWGRAFNMQAGLELGIAVTRDIDFVVNPMVEFMDGRL